MEYQDFIDHLNNKLGRDAVDHLSPDTVRGVYDTLKALNGLHRMDVAVSVLRDELEMETE